MDDNNYYIYYSTQGNPKSRLQETGGNKKSTDLKGIMPQKELRDVIHRVEKTRKFHQTSFWTCFGPFLLFTVIALVVAGVILLQLYDETLIAVVCAEGLVLEKVY